MKIKISMLLCTLLFISSTSKAVDFNLDKTSCESLATKMSTVAFSPDSNGLLYQSANLNKGLGLNYINRVRNELAQELSTLCKSDNIAFKKFKTTLHGSCSEKCQKNKDMLPKDLRTQADSTCLNICNQSHEKLEFVEQGYSLNKCTAGSPKEVSGIKASH